MAEYISPFIDKYKLLCKLDRLKNAKTEQYIAGINAARDTALNMKTADLALVRRGRWRIEAIYRYEMALGEMGYEPVYKCSACGMIAESYLRLDEPMMPEDADFPPYCPNCGARMDGGGDV